MTLDATGLQPGLLTVSMVAIGSAQMFEDAVDSR